jgi:hypothetical protein
MSRGEPRTSTDRLRQVEVNSFAVKEAEGLVVIDLLLRHDRTQTGCLPFGDARRMIGDRLHRTPFFAALGDPQGSPG